MYWVDVGCKAHRVGITDQIDTPQEARQALRGLLKLFEIAPVNRSVIEKALRSKIEDLEDAILEQAAWLVGAEAIITRNTKDFHRSSIKALDPAELLAAIEM